MPAIPPIDETQLQAISDVIGDTSEGLTGSEIGRLLARSQIEDPLPGHTKRTRLFEALRQKQHSDRCANNVFAFVQIVMEPVRYRGNLERFELLRERLNQALAFAGLHVGEDGKLKVVPRAQTLPQAQARASRLRAELVQRRVHHEVLRFCRADLLEEDYFHAVFEATKSVAQKIRDLTELTSDGAELVESAFGLKAPLLAINTLRSEPEQSEQKGFANLLKGMFGIFRNVPAHAPKIMWRIEEEDAFDLFSVVSYVHRRLEKAARVSGNAAPRSNHGG